MNLHSFARSHASRRDFNSDLRLLRIAALAVPLGAAGALAAWALLHLIRVFTNLFFFQSLSDRVISPAANTLGAGVIVVPAIGGLLIGLMARYGSEKIRGHGIPEAIEAILFGQSRMSPRVALLKPLSSGIAIGSGGPFGAEGPIIMTGGALGSLLGQCLHITGAERKTLLVAGATAGMTAVFGTPLAAVMLAVELLLFELRPRSLLPVAVACCVAAAVRPWLVDGGVLFPLHTVPPDWRTLLACIPAGLAAGMLSWIVSTSLYRVEDAYGRLPLHWMWWPALGGLAVGLGGWLQPRALGVGYDVIGDLLSQRLVGEAVLGLVACKAAMWVLALGSGTSGGVLAPLLMMGAGLGALLAPALGGDPGLWPLVLMAATLGGMMRAPVMAVMFALELTRDIDALLPLLASAAVAYGFTVLVMPRSILTEKIARRGHHIHREYGVDPLERHLVEDVMTPQVQGIAAELPIAEAFERYFGARQSHRAYPVVTGSTLVGMIEREAMAAGLEHPTARQVADLFGANVPPMALPRENCRTIATRLAVHGLERLPVVTDPNSRRLVGIVSRSDLVETSRTLFDEEERPQRFAAPALGDLRRRFRWLTGESPADDTQREE